MKKNNGGYKINICQYSESLGQTNNNSDKKAENSELKEQKMKDKKVDFDSEQQNKTALNINTKKSLKKSVLYTKKSFNKKSNNNVLNFEKNHKLDKSNYSINKINDLPYPKSSLNIKNLLGTKSFINDKSTINGNKSLLGINSINKSFHNKGKLNKTRNNFLKLINPNNKSKIISDSTSSANPGKEFVGSLGGDSLNIIQKNLQNKILDMGKKPDFLEFEVGPLDLSINKFHNLLQTKRQKLTKKKTKKDEDKKKDITSLERHQTVIHKKAINGLTNINANNSNSEDLLLGNFEKSCISKNLVNFSKNKIYNSLGRKMSNKNPNRLKKYYKINLIKSDANGRRASINHYLKSTHTFKSATVISRSKTSHHLKRKAAIDVNHSPRNNKFEITILKQRPAFVHTEKFRNLSHKKLVYDSLDDEEVVEDAINDNFFFNSDDKIVLIIDSIVLFFTFYNMFYKPLKLVLNNCDVKGTITDKNFDNIFNIFIDLIFIGDLIINFFKAYYNFDEQLVTKSEKIIINYLKGFFIVDFISGIPYYSIIKIIAIKNSKSLGATISCSKYYNHEINDVYQMIELLKLVKLIKCISNKNIAANYILNFLNQISFFETWSFLLSSVFLTLIVLHLTACLHIFVSSTAFPSIYFLITTVTSVGYGDITGNSVTEYVFQIFLLIIGIIAYSWLVSSISNYVKENNQQNEIYNQKLAILNEIKLEHSNFPKELYDKIHLHLEYINLKQKKDKSSLIDSLPHSVKQPLLHEMYKPMIENFIFFKNCKNSEFSNRVISKLKPVIAVKNDLLLEQGEIIEDTIFVKQGRLSLEVKIDADYPEKSVEKLLSEEYFFGVENNEQYQRSAFGGIINMTSNIHNQSFINKKNLYNLYSGNTLIDNQYKGIKSIVTNNKGEVEIQKHPNLNINYINLRILDIRKNEHFGSLLMFLNKRSPLTLRVKTKKAELFFLKKIDAIEISTSYPNIWKRVNKKSFHNLKEIKKIMKKIIKHFCETYGIDFDFGSTVYHNYNLKSNPLNKLKKLKKIKSKKEMEEMMKNINLMNKNVMNKKNMNNMLLRAPSLGAINSQFKMLNHLPKQTIITQTKTNFEKDIEGLIPKNFERNTNINKSENNKPEDRMNYFTSFKEVKNSGNSDSDEDSSDSSDSSDNSENSESKKESSEENKKGNNSPMDCSVSMIKVEKKDTFQGYGHPIYRDSIKNNIEINNNHYSSNNLIKLDNNKITNKSLSKGGVFNKTKDNNNINEIKSTGKYGEEETNNLIKFFGTPYYPEDINDEVYPGENFEFISPKNQSITNLEKEFLLSYDTKNNLPKIKNRLLSQTSLNNININNKSNNFTINNNFITNNVINNISSQKYNQNLSIFKFSLNYNKIISNKNKKKNDSDTLRLSISRNSFEISPYTIKNSF